MRCFCSAISALTTVSTSESRLPRSSSVPGMDVTRKPRCMTMSSAASSPPPDPDANPHGDTCLRRNCHLDRLGREDVESVEPRSGLPREDGRHGEPARSCPEPEEQDVGKPDPAVDARRQPFPGRAPKLYPAELRPFSLGERERTVEQRGRKQRSPRHAVRIKGPRSTTQECSLTKATIRTIRRRGVPSASCVTTLRRRTVPKNGLSPSRPAPGSTPPAGTCGSCRSRWSASR
jgi:hypothetical protein